MKGEGITITMVPVNVEPKPEDVAIVDFTADCRACGFRLTPLSRNGAYISGHYFPKGRADPIILIRLEDHPDQDTQLWYREFRIEVLDLVTEFFEQNAGREVKTPVLDAMLENMRSQQTSN